MGRLMNHRRARPFDGRAAGPQHGAGPVLYWMHREHRARHNWGLIHALELALTRKAPLAVVYCLADSFLDAARRQYDFLLGGLREVAADLEGMNIPFLLRTGDPPTEVARLAREVDAACVVTDFDSLKPKREWMRQAADGLDRPLVEVDSRNICPCWVVSEKREHAARTIRPKIHRLLDEFLEPFPADLPPPPAPWPWDVPAIDWRAAVRGLAIDETIPPLDWAAPGTRAGLGRLGAFIQHRLGGYEDSNDPNAGVVSGLSPWLHFGHISAQEAALAVSRSGKKHETVQSFLEQLVVRRELSDNFCLHAEYDSPACFPDWARQTLADHTGDERDYLYSKDEFERAATHDPLWNAAQTQMVETGYMHGYMRMYWAKKVLEWTRTPEEAMAALIRLNDRYEFDGRDANGYTGIAWSIGGVHDHGWKERQVFGKVRYMNFNGAKRKFDVQAYVKRWTEGKG
ncbi:deoxyribodipyrimidine photo-lyase [Desulfohalovibrio reitneri]|uniref:deoxyribodipyrimidine photo-lyase n=1 Tax=Desulfohalovibrio reitneri TaxID=1307759 RepID=UPI00054DC06B|nr:deoxyribodipyrimidine photo-lyase [Desulfohalovibrio reitneri]